MANKKHSSGQSSDESQSLSTPPPSKPLPQTITQPRPNRSKKPTIVAKEGAAYAELHRRFFSKDDDIVILKTFIDFKSETGKDPITDFTAFFDSFKDLLSVKATHEQVKNKIRKLKQKFLTKAIIDDIITFSSAHEKQLFELSQIIWSNESETEKISKKKSTAKKPVLVEEMTEATLLNVNDKSGKGEICLNEMKMYIDGNLMKRGFDLLEDLKREEFERRWKKLKIAELELFREHAELVEYQVSCMVEGLKGSS